MECADESFAEITTNSDGSLNWNGCIDKGSRIFRCPYPYIPCESMRKDENGDETRDFECDLTCEDEDKGGKRQTCNGGKKIKSYLSGMKLSYNLRFTEKGSLFFCFSQL